MSKHIKKAGLLAAAAVALTGMTAGVAMADPLVDEDFGDLTVHKFEQPVQWEEDTYGKPLAPDKVANLTPMEGVEFKAQQVNGVNLKENEGWIQSDTLIKDFQALSAQDQLAWTPPAPFTLSDGEDATTTADGSAKFPNLPVGLYLVTETATPTIEGKVITKALPFLVTIPLTDPTSEDTWFYDVNVYPKNIITGIEKEVVDIDAYGAGDEVEFKFYADIPGGEPTTKYVLTDQIDDRLNYVDGSVVVTFGDKPAVVDTDYTVDYTDHLLTITLTSPGRTAAYNALVADQTATVNVSLKAIVEANADGCVPNEVNLTFANKPGHDTEVPSNKVKTCWGGLKLFKHDVDGNKTPLAGAVFEIWGSHTDDFSTAKQVTVGGEKQWTTGADGTLKVTGLRYSDHANNVSPAPEDGYNYYWAEEVVAPHGYALLAQPIPFTVDTPVDQGVVLDVPNTPLEHLPRTGGSGIIPILIVGGVVLGVGVVLTRRSMKSTR